MASFKLTKKAKEDLKRIAIFTQESWGKQQRDAYIKQFDSAFKLIARKPKLGKDCSYIKEGYRQFPQGSHIIFYRHLDDKEILIIRILHKHMDVNSKLREA